MAIPLPQYESMGEMIQNRINQTLDAEAKQAQIKNALIKNKFAEPMAQAELEKNQLANQYYAPTTEATNALRVANTNKLNFQQQNPLLGLSGTAGQLGAIEFIKQHPELVSDPNAAAIIKKSIENQQNSSLGTGAQEELFFQQLVAKDNPQLKTPEQIYQAANAIRNGKFELPDGTKINELSPAASASLDRIVKGTTTSSVATSMITANQADSELNVLGKYALNGLKEFPNTYFNYNPEQLMASFKNDAESQKKLGRYIAARQLQYDIAQNEIKLAMGQPGVTSTQELMAMGQQNINSMYPKLGYTAREEAQRYQFEALKEGLKARKKAGISLSNAMKNPEEETTSETEQEQEAKPGNPPKKEKEVIKKEADKFKSETLLMMGPDRKTYNVPQGKAQKFIENGFKRVG